jgi:Family of unknown function (DUF6152)
MRQVLKAVGTVTTVLSLLAGIHSVAAHHSFSMFDFSKRVTVNGAVKELRWVNPHVSLLVYGATKEGEEPTEWLLEMTSPSVLSRLGWTKASFKPGDRVRAEFSPLRDNQQHGGSLMKITSIETSKTYSTNLLEQEDSDIK